MPKGTCLAKATSNIKPIALAIIELRLSESSRKFHFIIFFKIYSKLIVESVSGQSKGLFGLSFT